MEIDWTLLASFARVTHNNLDVAGGGMDTLYMPNFPTTVREVLAVRVRFDPDEVGTEHDASWSVVNPQGEVIAGRDDLALSTEHLVVHEPGWRPGGLYRFPITFDVEQDGPHPITFLVEGSSYSLPMEVVHGPVPSA